MTYSVEELIKDVWDVEHLKIHFSVKDGSNVVFTQTYKEWSNGEPLPGDATVDDFNDRFGLYLSQCCLTNPTIH